MKKLKTDFLRIGLLSTMMLASMFIFVACSSDDDNGGGGTDNDAPKYQDVSALYDITSGDSDIKSLELTESGNYIIIKNSGASASKAFARHKGTAVAKAPHMGLRATTGDTDRGYVYGTFTKVSDDEFILDGYGRVTITGSGDKAFSIKIKTNDGRNFTVQATEHARHPSSTLTNRLCRTWAPSSVRYVFTKNGKEIINVEYRKSEIRAKVDALIEKWEDTIYGREIREALLSYRYDDAGNEFLTYDDDVAQVTITRSGTYLTVDEFGIIEIGQWSWYDERKGYLLGTAYGYPDGHFGDNDYLEEIQGLSEVSFRGKQLAMTTEVWEEDDEVASSLTFVTTDYLDEVK